MQKPNTSVGLMLQVVLDNVVQLLSFWPEVRKNQNLAPETAKDILAAWAHLRRFPADKLAGQEGASGLEQLVRSDTKQLVVQFLWLPPFANQWIEVTERLGDCLDHTMSDERHREFEQNTRDHFFKLDEWLLAIYAAKQLADVYPEIRELCRNRLESWDSDVNKAYGYLFSIGIKEVFISAGEDAIEALTEYRADLQMGDSAAAEDVELWAVTDTYRAIASVWKHANE